MKTLVIDTSLELTVFPCTPSFCFKNVRVYLPRPIVSSLYSIIIIQYNEFAHKLQPPHYRHWLYIVILCMVFVGSYYSGVGHEGTQ